MTTSSSYKQQPYTCKRCGRALVSNLWKTCAKCTSETATYLSRPTTYKRIFRDNKLHIQYPIGVIGYNAKTKVMVNE